MFQSLEVFKLSRAMSQHAAQRQSVIAGNMANADTPGYAARDLAPFKETLRQSSGAFDLRGTRSGHFTDVGNTSFEESERASDGSPNGNSVSLEGEMLKSVDAKRQHDRALAIYKSSLNILRSSLGRS